MIVNSLHQLITTPTKKRLSNQLIFFLFLSLTFSVLYGGMALKIAFSGEYVIQDDARQHVFWMQRFLDSELFPNDIIADFFQSVAPWGYTNFYKLFSLVGIPPIFLSKILPITLGFIITIYLFAASMEIFPIPAAAFITTLVFNQNLWKSDDLGSATPRAFGYCLFIIFLYYFLTLYKENELTITKAIFTWLCLASLGLFYPHYIFIATGLIIFRSIYWEKGRIKITKNSRDYWFIGISLFIVFIVLLPYALKVSEFDPTISATQAKQLPEFLNGRAAFFHDNSWTFWLNGDRTGIFPKSILTPITFVAGLLLPFFLKFSSGFSLSQNINSKIKVLLQMLIVCVSMFFIAHAVIFTLHLPNRYTHYFFKIILAITTGIAIILMLDSILKWALSQDKNQFTTTNKSNKLIKPILGLLLTIIILTPVILYPLTWKFFPNSNYIVGENQSLYTYLKQQPKDIVIASISPGIDNLPSFSQRSIFVGWEYAIPYKVGYYKIISQRAIDLIYAQYSLELNSLKDFINQNKVDFWMINSTAFTPEYLKSISWLRQWKNIFEEILPNLENGNTPAIIATIKTCSVFQENDLILLDTNCILNLENSIIKTK